MTTPAEAGAGSSEDPCVVCVDDDPCVLSALRRLFQHEPFRFLTAADVVSALALLEANPVRAVISDERMPGMSGTDFLGEVHRRWPGMARVILTGYPGHDVMRRGLESGVDCLLSKPWDGGALRQTIRRLCEEVSRSPSEDPGETSEKPSFDIGGEAG